MGVPIADNIQSMVTCRKSETLFLILNKGQCSRLKLEEWDDDMHTEIPTQLE